MAAELEDGGAGSGVTRALLKTSMKMARSFPGLEDFRAKVRISVQVSKEHVRADYATTTNRLIQRAYACRHGNRRFHVTNVPLLTTLVQLKHLVGGVRRVTNKRGMITGRGNAPPHSAAHAPFHPSCQEQRIPNITMLPLEKLRYRNGRGWCYM